MPSPRFPTALSSSRPGPKRPPVNAAPAEIVAPISLRRVRPGEQAVQAGNGTNGASTARNAPVASGSGAKGGVKKGQPQANGQKKAQDLPARPEVPRQPVASTSATASGLRLAQRISVSDPEEPEEEDRRNPSSGRNDARGETNGRGRGRGRGRGGAGRGGGGGGRGGGHANGRENGRGAANGGVSRPRTKDPRLLCVQVFLASSASYACRYGRCSRLPWSCRRLGELASWVLVDNKAVPLYKTQSEGPMKLCALSYPPPLILADEKSRCAGPATLRRLKEQSLRSASATSGRGAKTMRQTFCARSLWTESYAGASALADLALEALSVYDIRWFRAIACR